MWSALGSGKFPRGGGGGAGGRVSPGPPPGPRLPGPLLSAAASHLTRLLRKPLNLSARLSEPRPEGAPGAAVGRGGAGLLAAGRGRDGGFLAPATVGRGPGRAHRGAERPGAATASPPRAREAASSPRRRRCPEAGTRRCGGRRRGGAGGCAGRGAGGSARPAAVGERPGRPGSRASQHRAAA